MRDSKPITRQEYIELESLQWKIEDAFTAFDDAFTRRHMWNKEDVQECEVKLISDSLLAMSRWIEILENKLDGIHMQVTTLHTDIPSHLISWIDSDSYKEMTLRGGE